MNVCDFLPTKDDLDDIAKSMPDFLMIHEQELYCLFEYPRPNDRDHLSQYHGQ